MINKLNINFFNVLFDLAPRPSIKRSFPVALLLVAVVAIAVIVILLVKKK